MKVPVFLPRAFVSSDTMASVAVPAQRVIFLACGSFNPPTHLHLRLFELARDHFRVHQGAATVLGEVKVTMKEGNDT